MNNLQNLVSRAELNKKLNVFLGCLVEAVALLAVCLSGLCKTKVSLNKSGAKLALVVALALTLSDIYSPPVGRALRQGAGFGVGALLVGFSP